MISISTDAPIYQNTKIQPLVEKAKRLIAAGTVEYESDDTP